MARSPCAGLVVAITLCWLWKLPPYLGGHAAPLCPATAPAPGPLGISSLSKFANLQENFQFLENPIPRPYPSAFCRILQTKTKVSFEILQEMKQIWLTKDDTHPYPSASRADRVAPSLGLGSREGPSPHSPAPSGMHDSLGSWSKSLSFLIWPSIRGWSLRQRGHCYGPTLL